MKRSNYLFFYFLTLFLQLKMANDDELTLKPSAHDARFVAGSLTGRYYVGCTALSQAGRNVGLASYGAGCRAGLQARCRSFVAHERNQKY